MHAIFLHSNHTFLSAYAHADFFGKCIFFALFFISIVCWITLIRKAFEMRAAKKRASGLLKACQGRESLLKLSFSDAGHPFGKLFSSIQGKTMEILEKNQFFSQEAQPTHLSCQDISQVESCALITISSEGKKLEKNLFVLATIYTLAPFLGLLGTVWGILVTFSHIQGGGPSTLGMLSGLSTALATTVLGLLIAIPALIGHNILQNRLKSLRSDMTDFLYHLLSTIEMQYRKPNP